MADTVSTLTSFPPDNVAKLSPKEYDRAIHTYITKVKKIPDSAYTKQSDKTDLLDLLNPAVNSLGFLVALCEQVKAAGKNQQKLESLANQCLIFLAVFDPLQVRYAGDLWYTVLQLAWDALAVTDTLPNFVPISTAWLRLDPTAGTFTTFHYDFVRKCVERGVPSQALPIIDKTIYAYPSTGAAVKGMPEDLLCGEHDGPELSNTFITIKTGFTDKIIVEQVLYYYLLGAHVYIGQRNWSRARLFLECVLLTPSQNHGVSALQLEAYKKWVLVGLLAEGKAFPLPRTHDPAVMKTIRAVAKSYDTLAEDFVRRDWKKYQADMDQGTNVWYSDGNMGMVQEAGDALLRFRTLDLQKTFAALPISRVAVHIGFAPDVTLNAVTNMIRQGHLNGSITQAASGISSDAVLRFHFSTPSSSNQDQDLEAQTKRIEALVTFIRDADRRLQLTKEYTEYQKRNKRTGGELDPAEQMDLTFDQPGPVGGFGVDEDGDEDIMAG
jgi:COP9 signalosome complex subunit 3